ncbi:MAG: HlyD family efflux transporter periplasmic adaptor subunit [Betaproteobacteria bacterium]|nr:HlyD family efflux transporter periplasmic adaptor subunit [Betaproteobacteria bacterium]
MSSVTPEIHETLERGRVADLASRRTYEQAWRQFAQHQSIEEFCSSWLVIQAHAIGGASDGVVVLLKPGTNAFAPVAFFPDTPRDRSYLAKVSERALQTGQGILEPREQSDAADAHEPRYQLAYPLRLDGEVRGVVGFELDWRPEAELQTAMREVQWGSCWLEVLLRRRADPKEVEMLRLKLALDQISTLLEQPSLKESTTAFTTELATRLGCDRVTLGLVEGRRVIVTAISHSPMFEKRANLVRAIERAMEEAIDQEEAVVYPPVRDDRPVVARAHEALLVESEASSAATFPLVHGERVVGALTFERAAGHRFELPTLEICEAVASVAGPIIELKQTNETSLPAHAARSAKDLWERLFGPDHPGVKLAAIGVIALAAFIAFATGEFRVSADSMVEGAVQRAVTAPINGFVKDAPLRAGDTVRQGQVIARLDDRDLRLERARLQSQREQFVNQFREAMGKRERAQVQIVSAQIAQAEAQLALVEEQLARTTLVAPFDGLIVRGDLSQSLGSPIERGQVLFEVAPLEDYRVVLRVDERDIAHVEKGQRGELTVTSMPGDGFAFRVDRITPVNMAKEGRNLFRVEAVLEAGAGARLRPGMEGVGKIHIDERKLVWIWTHGLTDWVRLWMWSWLP